MEEFVVSFDPALQAMVSEGKGLMSVWRELERRGDFNYRMATPYGSCGRCERLMNVWYADSTVF